MERCKLRKTLGLFVCSLVTATALLLLSGTIWAADLPNSIALIADISPDGTLTHAQDYAAYGASQMLTQLGVPYRIEPTDTLTNLNLLSDYTIVIYPGPIVRRDKHADFLCGARRRCCARRSTVRRRR